MFFVSLSHLIVPYIYHLHKSSQGFSDTGSKSAFLFFTVLYIGLEKFCDFAFAYIKMNE